MAAVEDLAVGFLGVTTRFSAVHRVFDRWSDCLGSRLVLRSMDLPLKSNPGAYRSFVADIRNGRNDLRGAVITSHKVGVYEAASQLLDVITPTASRLGEVGMIYWREGRLVGDASDPFAILKVARRLLTASESWKNGPRAAIILGGGGAGVALADSLIHEKDLGCTRVTIAEIDSERVLTLRSQISSWSPPFPVQVQLVKHSSDDLVSGAGSGSLIANASGLGKDRPGSPISEFAVFPHGAIAWEFNYRFIAQVQPTFWDISLRQAQSQTLTLEDGWDYFVWNWLEMLSNIVGLSPDSFYLCFSRVANEIRYSSIR